MKYSESFNTREEANAEKNRLLGEYRSLHTDYINGEFVVTFVNGDDDPVNSEEAELQHEKFIRLKELNKKVQDRTITHIELVELIGSR